MNKFARYVGSLAIEILTSIPWVLIGFLVASGAVGFSVADLTTVPWTNGWVYMNIVFWPFVLIWWGLLAIWVVATSYLGLSIIGVVAVVVVTSLGAGMLFSGKK